MLFLMTIRFDEAFFSREEPPACLKDGSQRRARAANEAQSKSAPAFLFPRSSLSGRLFRRLEPGRVDPRLDVRGALRLPDLLEEVVPFSAIGHAFRLGSLAIGELREAVLKRCSLLETTPGRRERERAFSSPIEATTRAVIMHNRTSGRYVLCNSAHTQVTRH